MISRRAVVTALGVAPLLRRFPRLGSVVAEALPMPSRAQLAWQQDELAMFTHFGVNTFTDREWGDGREDPAIFAPAALDCRQWTRAARNAGFRSVILTAKHHDGFCLWPTRTTTHSVASSPFRGGQGDVVREFVDACRAEGLKPGLYCSPWDRNNPTYGDSPRYNALYHDQLTELLTRYGPIAEVWFDGANGEGPNGKHQVYDWPATFGLVRRLMPDAVIFSDAGPDIRWIGNERGSAGDPNWSTVDPDAVPYPGADGPGIIEALQHGDPAGAVWRPGETDLSIRPGWFHHDAEDQRVKSAEELLDLYFTSVGRNSKLLLNVPPTKAGLLHPTDVDTLLQSARLRREQFADDLTAGRAPKWRLIGDRGAELMIDLGAIRRVGIADLREPIASGQRVARYSLEGNDGTRWSTLSEGETIGYRKLDRFPAARIREVRLRILDAVATPRPVSLALYAD